MSLRRRAERRRHGLAAPRSAVMTSRLWTRTDDGARLDTILLRPVDPSVRRGTVLIRSERAPDDDGPLARLAGWLAEDGRNVVLQSCRGRGASEGDFEPFVHETADAGATLRWIASESAFEGPLVAVGLGYAAFTAWASAAAGPGTVTAVASGFGARDPWAWLHRDGVLQLEAALVLAARLDGREGIEPDTLDLERAGRHVPEAECDRVAVRTLDALRAWRAHPERDAWWEARTPPLADPHRTLLVGGWYDAALAASLADHAELAVRAERDARKPPTLVIGPWGAAPTPEARRPGAPRPLAVVAQAISRFVARAVEEPGAREVAPRVFVPGEGWREGRPWPPRTAQRRWLLRSTGFANSAEGDGRLESAGDEAATSRSVTEAVSGEERPDAFVADPAAPVPSLGGVTWRGLAGAVPQDPLLARGDVLCFTSAPLSEPLELAGSVGLVLHVRADAAPFDVCAKLTAVGRDGASRWLAEGVARRADGDDDAAMPIELGPASARVAAGERLRLALAGSSVPRFARSPREKPARCVVLHDAAHPSALSIDVAER